MRILQLGKFYPIRGGVEKVMWILTRGLSAHKVSCDMLCARLRGDKADPADWPIEEGNDFCFNPHGTVYCVRALTKKAATMISPAMIKWLKKHKAHYDIIHIHHPDPMAALALWMSGYKGKVVLHWHSDILSQQFLLKLYGPLQNWLVKRADVIVGTTPAYIKASPYLQDVQDKCTYVPIGIQPVVFNQEGVDSIKRRFPGKTILLSIGRLVPYKGFSVLIKAMKYLPEKYHLIIGGMGPLKEELEALIKHEGLGDRVTLEGYIPDSTLPDYYGACSIFVLSSIMKTEAFGIVQIEAMSCGKPVVATMIPGSGVSWVNQDGVSGRNVAIEDPKAMAAAIENIDGNYDEYSHGAKTRFDAMFTEEEMIKSIIKIYETLV